MEYYDLPKEICMCHNSIINTHVLPDMASLQFQINFLLKSIFQDLHLKPDYQALHEILRCDSLILDKSVMLKVQCLK